MRIAARDGRFLRLPLRETETLKFLVHKHLLMSHLAFRRDTSDDQLVVRFAVEVGSPERLDMLLVLTAADFAAVGPGVWNNWKAEVLVDLYQQTMRHLAGDSPRIDTGEQVEQRRSTIRACLSHEPEADLAWYDAAGRRAATHLSVRFAAGESGGRAEGSAQPASRAKCTPGRAICPKATPSSSSSARTKTSRRACSTS